MKNGRAFPGPVANLKAWIDMQFFYPKFEHEWCVINWLADNSLQILSELIVLSYQPSDECHII